MTYALRSFSIGFLAWNLALLFPGMAEPLFLAAAALVGMAGGALTRGFRSWVSLAIGTVLFAFFGILITGTPSWFGGTEASPLDQLPLWAGRQLTFAILPFGLGWVEGWAFTGRPRRRGTERIVNAAAVAALFWSQGPYHVTIYPHPLVLALVFAGFLASELVLLAGKPPKVGPWAPVILVIAVGAGLFWGLLNRYEDQSTSSGGGLMKPDLFQFDFAPLVRLEDEITLGDNLVLLYREEGTPKRRYLRRLVLDSYDPARGFSLTEGKGPAVGRRVQQFSRTAGTLERVPVTQEYYLVNMDPSSLLALNDPSSVTPFAQWDHSSFVNAYRVESLVAGDSFWLYNDVESDDLPKEQRDLDLQGGTDPEIRALALQMCNGAKTPFEKASAIVEHLREDYFYSLKPGPPGPRGALKHFLFEGKKGYCSYFAFSMTLLLRSVDVPARIAVGFATDPSETVLGFNPVRAYQAHAWVEVPLGPYGWVEFDPTSSTPAPGELFQFPKGTDPQILSKLIAEILGAKPRPLADLGTETGPEKPSFTWDTIWSAGTAAFPWALALFLVGGNEAWRFRWSWRRLWAKDDREKAALRWAEVVWRARRARRGPFRGETPEAWAARDPELAQAAREVSKARYSRSTSPGADQTLGRSCGEQIRRFDKMRPPLHRLLGILFPWWPR